MHETYRKLTITATTPTRDLDSTDYVFSLLRDSDYQVIPSHPGSLAYDTDTLLLSVLASRQHKDVLLDICLPYYHQQPGQPTMTYFGRYLIFNQVLLGVRLACAPQQDHKDPAPYPQRIKKWQAGVRAFHEVSPIIKKFYRQERLESVGQIIVGDFSIRHKGVHIALLFESQITLMPNILSNYSQQGCGIISIVNDLPRLPNFTQKLSFKTYRNRSRCENELIQFGKKNSQVIIYSGMRMASSQGLYLAYSFIMEKGRLKEESQFLFNDGAAITQKVVINTKLSKKNDEKVYEIPSDSAHLQKAIKQQEETVEPPLNSNFSNLFSTMRAWYLFKQINKGCPFVLSLPLGPLSLRIFEEMRRISVHINFPLFNFISLYKRKGNTTQISQIKQYGLHIYGSIQQYLIISTFKYVNIYTQDLQEEQQITHLISYYRQKYNIRLCHEYLQANSQIASIRNTINMVAQKCLSHNIVNMKDLVRIARQHKLNNTSMMQLIKVLKCKLRTSPVTTPFFHYIIYTPEQTLRAHMEDSELTLISKDYNSLMTMPSNLYEENRPDQTQNECIQILDDEPANMRKKNKRQESSFQKKMSQMRKFQQKQLKFKEQTCHSCKLLMHRELSFSCQTCHFQNCNFCIKKVLQKPPKTRQEYQICIVCNNLCKCDDCHKKLLDLLLPEKKYEQNRQTNRKGCPICQIQGRRPMQIQVTCQNCNKLMCYSCSKGKKNGDYMQWICNECFKKEEQTMQKAQITNSSWPSTSTNQMRCSSPNYQRDDKRDERQRTRMKGKKETNNSPSMSGGKPNKGVSPKRQHKQQQNGTKIKRFYYQKTNRRSRSSSQSNISSSFTNSKQQDKRKDAQPEMSKRAKRRLSRSQRRANRKLLQEKKRQNQLSEQRQKVRRQERKKYEQWMEYLQNKQRQQRAHRQSHMMGYGRQYSRSARPQLKKPPSNQYQRYQRPAPTKHNMSLWGQPNNSTSHRPKETRQLPTRPNQQRNDYNGYSPSSQYGFNDQYHY